MTSGWCCHCERSEDSIHIPAEQQSKDPGFQVVGGGYSAGRDDVFVSQNQPLSSYNGWRVRAAGVSGYWQLWAYAICVGK